MANENDRPIINSGVDNIIATATDIKNDLSTLRPLLRNMLFNAYAADKVENTPIATFPDGADNVPMKSATFAITPVQDLHGYDSPWPAGGGKNKFNKDGTDTTKGFVTGACLLDNGQIYVPSTPADWNISEYTPVSPSTQYTLSGLLAEGSNNPSICQYDASKNFITGTAYANNASRTITTDAAAAYVRISIPTANLNALQLELGSIATAWTPYSNICPISGFTGAEITDRGVNLCDEEWEVGTINNDTGQDEYDSNNIRTKNYNPCPAVSEVFIKCFNGTTPIRYYFYDSNKAFISGGITLIIGSIVQVPANAKYFRVRTTQSYGTTYLNDISINYPSTDTAYHASVGATKDITWQDEAGTVYGGTLEYLGGDAWRLTKTMESVDLGDLTWALHSSGIFYSEVNTSIPVDLKNAICSSYGYDGDANASNASAIASNLANGEMCSFSNSANQGRFAVKDTAYSDAATFKTAMSGVQLVYELATPVVYDLTEEELATVLGNNNVFSNTGDVTELVYRADTALYIDKKLAE